MNKLLKIGLALAWIIVLALFIVAITDFVPGNIFKPFKWYILVAFVILTGATKEYLV